MACAMANDDAASAVTQAFARRLAVVRQSYGQRTGRPMLDMQTFAAELGVSAERYRKYERGEREPPLWLLVKVSDLTGFSLDFMIRGMPVGTAA
jgi:transcriptional regulator with XRE-family HTH domain